MGDDWKAIFVDSETMDKSYCDDKVWKTIELNGKNERYLLFRFELTADSQSLEMYRLKWYTTDPAEYKWDIEDNIKSLTYKASIVTANRPNRAQDAKNMLSEANGLSYSTMVYGKQHK